MDINMCFMMNDMWHIYCSRILDLVSQQETGSVSR